MHAPADRYLLDRLQGYGIELQQACRGGYARRRLTLRLQVAVGSGARDVDVSAVRREGRRMHGAAQLDGDLVVCDHLPGCGVPDDDLHSLWRERFSRRQIPSSASAGILVEIRLAWFRGELRRARIELRPHHHVVRSLQTAGLRASLPRVDDYGEVLDAPQHRVTVAHCHGRLCVSLKGVVRSRDRCFCRERGDVDRIDVCTCQLADENGKGEQILRRGLKRIGQLGHFGIGPELIVDSAWCDAGVEGGGEEPTSSVLTVTIDTGIRQEEQPPSPLGELRGTQRLVHGIVRTRTQSDR